LRQPYGWARDAAARGQIARVFTLSHGDIYDTDRAQRAALDAMREGLFETMRGTLAQPARDGRSAQGGLYWIALSKRKKSLMPADLRVHPCVVQGFTAENQDWLDRRWAALEAQGASHHVFVLVEPWVGPIRSLPPSLAALGRRVVMVLGGESCTLTRQTPRAMPVAEAVYIRDLCAEAGINFFFKQWGSIGPDGVRRPKKENGRLLEGKLHDEFPEPPIDGLPWLTPEPEDAQ
jgi:protein gp37